jgi:phosphopantetheinyl transferase (holo-ACP synthase)
VNRTDDGWCGIVLHGAASALAGREGIAGLALSMSHAQEYATATVVGQRVISDQETQGGAGNSHDHR